MYANNVVRNKIAILGVTVCLVREAEASCGWCHCIPSRDVKSYEHLDFRFSV